MPSREDNSYDKLYKIRPYLKNLNKQFLNCYEPSGVKAIDESMIKFKGSCNFKQYIPKFIKRGYKVWVRADENGYVCQFEIYTRKGKEKGMGLGESVVEKLCKAISNKFYKIFADNFFSSVHLAYCLKEKQLGYSGTIRSTRKNIPNMKNEKSMKRGEIDWRMEENDLSIAKWMDNKVVYFISNMHNPEKSESVSRKNKDRTKVVIGGKSSQQRL